MKRQWKIAFALICCLALLSTLFVACDLSVVATFDLNYDGAQPITKSTIMGATVTPPTVTRDGYEFEGWYLDPDCTVLAKERNFVLRADTTFYANWTSTAVTLESISATYNGSNLEVGWKPHKSQFTVTATYSDGSSNEVTDFTISEIDTSTAGAKTVTVTYTENNVTKTADVSVTVVEPVEEKVLVSIEAVYTGSDVLVGEQLAKSAIIVTAYYDNDTHRVVTDFEISELDSETAGEKQLTVTYTENEVTQTTTVTVNVVEKTVADMYIHFLELGNNSNGDCIYIKAGDTDILIDAGSSTGSAETIEKYVDKYCTDGILEYVIVTHGDTDHISAFVGTTKIPGIFEYYECETIIQFARTGKNTNILHDYETKRDEAVASGANCYTALECYNNENGAKRVYELADGITMEILYQKYYETSTSNENDYSVCVMFTQGDNHYLFLGDLEEAGEKSLVEKNPDLPTVELYKAGHHGSQTSASELLMEKIQPQYICICCVAGHTEYTQNLENTFPAQDFIDRIAPYTDNVYATTWGHIKQNPSNGRWNSDGYESMNGNITFSCVNGVIEVHGSNNDTKLKDTQWFSEYRTMPDAWK